MLFFLLISGTNVLDDAWELHDRTYTVAIVLWHLRRAMVAAAWREARLVSRTPFPEAMTGPCQLMLPPRAGATVKIESTVVRLCHLRALVRRYHLQRAIVTAGGFLHVSRHQQRQ